MGSMSVTHWLIVLAIVLVCFGAGKIPTLMGDVAKGIKTFKKGMKDDEDEAAKPADASKPLEHAAQNAASQKPATTAESHKAAS